MPRAILDITLAAGSNPPTRPGISWRDGPRRTARHYGTLQHWQTAHRPGSSIYLSREHAGAVATLPGTCRWRLTTDWEDRRPTGDATPPVASSSTSSLPCRYG